MDAFVGPDRFGRATIYLYLQGGLWAHRQTTCETAQPPRTPVMYQPSACRDNPRAMPTHGEQGIGGHITTLFLYRASSGHPWIVSRLPEVQCQTDAQEKNHAIFAPHLSSPPRNARKKMIPDAASNNNVPVPQIPRFSSLLELLLGAELVRVTALPLPAVGRAGW